MARPRKQTYTMQQYLDNVREGYVLNDADTQRNPAWKPIIDGLAVTILTDDYIPAIILAEEESGQMHIVDGGSRTASFMMIRYGNYKIKSSVEDPIIHYKKMCKDDNGKSVWEDSEFDIRNKTFDQFPKELQKKFNEYQMDTVIHEGGEISKYLKRYNLHTSMTTNQKMFVYLPKFAKKIREITSREFFVNFSSFTDKEKEKGILERTVLETVMCTFHLDKWSKMWKNNPSYLDRNSTYEEFEKIEENISRIEKIVTEETKVLFNSKDTFIWLSFFDKFTKIGLPDKCFGDFLQVFVNELWKKEIDGKTFGNKGVSTKDKSVIIERLHILEVLMDEYLRREGKSLTKESFVSKMVDIPIEEVEEDMDCYEETLNDLEDNTIKDGSRLLEAANRLSLLSMMAYSYKHNVDLDSWLAEYAGKNNMYLVDQRENYLHMLEDFNNYQQCHSM